MWKSHGFSIPIGSMYAIYGNIYHQYTPNVSIYTIHWHGSYGICKWSIVYDSIRCEPHLLAGSIPIVTEAQRDSNAGPVVQQRWVKLRGLDRVWRDRQMKCSLPRNKKTCQFQGCWLILNQTKTDLNCWILVIFFQMLAAIHMCICNLYVHIYIYNILNWLVVSFVSLPVICLIIPSGQTEIHSQT